MEGLGDAKKWTPHCRWLAGGEDKLDWGGSNAKKRAKMWAREWGFGETKQTFSYAQQWLDFQMWARENWANLLFSLTGFSNQLRLSFFFKI